MPQVQPARAGLRRGLTGLFFGLLAAAIAQTYVVLPTAAQELMQDDGGAFIRFVHASPTAPALDLTVDGAPVVQGLVFGAATDIFVSVSPGTHVVEAAPAEGSGTEVIAEASIDLAVDVAYVVAVTGLQDDTSIQIYPVDTSATSDGRARVRLIACAPDASTVALAGIGSVGSIEGVAFLDASDYVEIETGSYDLTLDATGADQVVTVDVGSLAFGAGAIYDLFVIGLIADGSLSLVVVRA